MLPSRMEKPVGKVTIPCNPTSLEAVTVEPLSVPSENFCVNGTTTATNSYYLRFCVRRLSSAISSVRQTRGRDSSSDLGMLTGFIGSLRSPWKSLNFGKNSSPLKILQKSLNLNVLFWNFYVLKFWRKDSCKIWHFTTTWL